MAKILVLYYSSYGHVDALAQAIAEGASEAGGNVTIGRVPGRMSSQMASFWDRTGGLWMKGALVGKVGASFTSTASQNGGQETTQFSILTNLLHHGMTIVGLDYGFSGQMNNDAIVGGSPYGASTVAGGDGSRTPHEIDLDGAKYLGGKVARTAAKLAG